MTTFLTLMSRALAVLAGVLGASGLMAIGAAFATMRLANGETLPVYVSLMNEADCLMLGGCFAVVAAVLAVVAAGEAKVEAAYRRGFLR